MNIRLFLYGLGIWTGATLALRSAGQHLLRPGDWKGTLILFVGELSLDELARAPIVQTISFAAGTMACRSDLDSTTHAPSRPIFLRILSGGISEPGS